MTQRSISCWVVTEGLTGTENQCLGIADALEVSPVVKRIKLRFPWKQLSPYLRCGHQWAFDSAGDNLSPPWPDLVLASGRKSIAAALHIKQQSQGKTLVVQVQDPRIPAGLFDLVTVPQHDPTRGENVVTTTGALHRVTAAKLATEMAKFPSLRELPQPRAAVMIGGNSKAHRLTEESAATLAARLQELSADYSLMITVSRRTPPACLAILQKALTDNDRVYFWEGSGNNPYFAFLGLADFLLVTEDSVSMTSEAISTGKPVYTIPMEGGAARVDKFHQLLQTQGYTRILPQEGKLKTWHYTPPQDTVAVAEKIKALLEERVKT
ncbi:MAG: hypothetical protein EP349_03525 [Alphaproteobacteria bacterium]|nr:MAG: hypothetical protein EP349_03525 [Alphaproteobacteria bacterium]